MQYFEASTNFVLRKTTSKKQDKPCSIYASVECSWRKEPIYLSTGKKILPSLFSKSGKPITSDFEEGSKAYQEMRELSVYLEKLKRQISDVIFALNTNNNGDDFSLEDIDEKISSIIKGKENEKEITIIERFVRMGIETQHIVQFLNAVAVVYFKQPLKRGIFRNANSQMICDHLSEIGITNDFMKKMSSNAVKKVFVFIEDNYSPTTCNSIKSFVRVAFRNILNIKLDIKNEQISSNLLRPRCILTEEEIEIVLNEWLKIPPARGKIQRYKNDEDLCFKVEFSRTKHLYIGCFILQCLSCVRFSDISKLVLGIQENRNEMLQEIAKNGVYLMELTTRKCREEVTIPISEKVIQIVDKLILDKNLAPFVQFQRIEDLFSEMKAKYKQKECTIEDIIKIIPLDNVGAQSALKTYYKNKDIKQFFENLRKIKKNYGMNPHLQKFFSQLVQEGKLQSEGVLVRKKQDQRTIYKKVDKWSIISSHSGRATFCCNAFKRGLSESQIIAISGHRDFKTTYKHYLNSDSKRDKRRSDVLQAFKMLQM